MQVKIKNGNLIIVLPLQKPKLSASRKSFVVATSRGVQQTTARVEGKVVRVVANGFVETDDEEAISHGDNPKKKTRK